MEKRPIVIPDPVEILPLSLQAIYEAVNRSCGTPSNVDRLQPIWAAHAEQAKRQIGGVHSESNGEILYLGTLSPGCQACKAGSWDCIFITMACDLNCPFCYSPHAVPPNYIGSTFGATPEQIAANHAKTHITGISFSGGEPFLERQRLFDWLGWFKTRYPDKYYWLYTNGLTADSESLQQLKQLGLDEIRFNLAATGYDHPAVLKNLALAARFIPTVTVEIPAVPVHAPKLLVGLQTWTALGVRFLNLHELIYEPGTNSATMAGARQAVITADGHQCHVNPESRALILKVMRYVQEQGLSLSVNECSLQGKLRQLRGRRRSLAPITKTPYEKLVNNEFLECYCAYLGDEIRFFHPDTLDAMRRQYPRHQFVRLGKIAPLSLQEEEKWVIFQPV